MHTLFWSKGVWTTGAVADLTSITGVVALIFSEVGWFPSCAVVTLADKTTIDVDGKL